VLQLDYHHGWKADSQIHGASIFHRRKPLYEQAETAVLEISA
jgi:hypothetical protein